MKKIKFILALHCLLGATQLQSQVIDISTGVNSSGNPINYPSLDDDWWVSSPCLPAPCNGPYQQAPISNQLFTYQAPNPPYWQDVNVYSGMDPTVRWLCPHLNSPASGGALATGTYGNYYYKMNFNATTCFIDSARVRFTHIGGDDRIDTVFINGHPYQQIYYSPNPGTGGTFLVNTAHLNPSGSNEIKICNPNYNTHHGVIWKGTISIWGPTLNPSFNLGYIGASCIATPLGTGNNTWHVWGSPNGNPGSYVNLGIFNTPGALTLPASWNCYYVTHSISSGNCSAVCAAQSICNSRCLDPNGGGDPNLPPGQKTAGIATATIAQEYATVTIFPNPAKDQVTFNVATLADSEFNITITDITGRTIKTFENVKTKDKKSTINWDTPSLSNGTYLVKIQTTNNQVITKKLLIE